LKITLFLGKTRNLTTINNFYNGSPNVINLRISKLNTSLDKYTFSGEPWCTCLFILGNVMKTTIWITKDIISKVEFILLNEFPNHNHKILRDKLYYIPQLLIFQNMVKNNTEDYSQPLPLYSRILIDILGTKDYKKIIKSLEESSIIEVSDSYLAGKESKKYSLINTGNFAELIEVTIQYDNIASHINGSWRFKNNKKTAKHEKRKKRLDKELKYINVDENLYDINKERLNKAVFEITDDLKTFNTYLPVLHDQFTSLMDFYTELGKQLRVGYDFPTEIGGRNVSKALTFLMKTIDKILCFLDFNDELSSDSELLMYFDTITRNLFEKQKNINRYVSTGYKLKTRSLKTFSTVDGYGRYHSTFTSLFGDYRKNNVSICNEETISLDIKTSQPAFMLKVIEDNGTDVDVKELESLKTLIKTNDLYQFLLDETGISIDRDIFKQSFFRFLYGQPNMFKPYEITDVWAKKVNIEFKKNFPTIWDWITSVKKSGIIGDIIDVSNGKKHSSLSIAMQKVESDLVLDVVCPQIKKINKRLHFFTVHDSITVQKKFGEEVRKIFQESLDEYGIHTQIIKE